MCIMYKVIRYNHDDKRETGQICRDVNYAYAVTF